MATHARHRDRPVFVDPSGRRHRLVTRACWGLGVLVLGYVALILASLVVSPGLGRLSIPGVGPVLPGPAAAPLTADGGEPVAPDRMLSRDASPTPSPTPSAPSRAQASASAAAAVARAAASISPAAVPGRTGAPTALPTTATPPAGRPTAAPTARSTAAPTAGPGQASRTPRPRPTPPRGPR